MDILQLNSSLVAHISDRGTLLLLRWPQNVVQSSLRADEAKRLAAAIMNHSKPKPQKIPYHWLGAEAESASLNNHTHF